jgi:hypothetical protein
MGGPTRSKPIGTVQEVLLIDGFQEHRYCPLQQLVFRGRNADRTSFFPRPFRDMHAPDRWRKVGPRFGPVQ